jgi:hypothetical protein
LWASDLCIPMSVRCCFPWICEIMCYLSFFIWCIVHPCVLVYIFDMLELKLPAWGQYSPQL